MKIIRSRRKTLALVVLADGELLARAPLYMPVEQIEAFAQKHNDWVEKNRARVLTQAAALPGSLGFYDGARFPLLGKDYPLRLGSARPALQFNGKEFRLDTAAQAQAASLFKRWYRSRALVEFTLRVQQLAGLHGFVVNNVRVSSARTRWGSCSAKGTLSFTWRLVIAPPEIIDYVIIHELCHLRERNHSAKFWALVGTLLPDFAARRKWLKENGKRLDIAGV